MSFSSSPQVILINLFKGDYDGDTALVIWATGIVTNFQNADEKYSREPPGLDVCFTRDKESGTAFLQRVRTWEPNMRIQAMQIYLLGALGDPSIVGTYSTMHDNAVYELGYGNPRTVKLAAKYVLSQNFLGILKIPSDSVKSWMAPKRAGGSRIKLPREIKTAI